MKNILVNLVPAAMLLLGTLAGQAQEQDIRFSYSDGVMGSAIGNKGANPYDCCLFLNDPDYVGMKVKSIQILFGYTPAVGVTDYTVWTANSLPDSGRPQTNESISVTMDTTQTGNPNIGTAIATFKNPVTITEDGIYCGYSFNIPDNSGSIAQFPVIMTGP